MFVKQLGVCLRVMNMEYNELVVDKFLSTRIPPMLVGKIMAARNSMNMENYPADSFQYTRVFLNKVNEWILASKFNTIDGLNNFTVRHAILGVTQQIDELHYLYKDRLVIFEGEYAYHWRLNPNITRINHYTDIKPNSVLVMSYPSVKFAGNFEKVEEVLDYCFDNGVDVHIDAAWLGQCRNIYFDAAHPAVKTFSVSLSKAFFMGSQRIGIRYSKDVVSGPISIMNDFGYNNVSDMWIGCHMIDTFGEDFWWKNYADKYTQVCKDFNLNESDSFNIAFNGNTQVSIRTPLRLLIDKRFDARGYNV